MFEIAMGWRRLLVASWPVDPAVVAGHLPDGLDVDTFDGDAWLSVVPFTNVDVRPLSAPRWAGFDLPELNLRTYVTHDGVPGVYFFSLDADGLLGVAGARLFHGLPYYLADMHIDDAPPVEFRSRRTHPGSHPTRFDATYEPTGERFYAERGSLAQFLVERYRYYADVRGHLRVADVEHGPWPLYDATWDERVDDLFAANGFDRPEGEPHLLYSPGFDVYASASRRV